MGFWFVDLYTDVLGLIDESEERERIQLARERKGERRVPSFVLLLFLRLFFVWTHITSEKVHFFP